MAESVRRSSRRKVRKATDFNVGDIVEVTRNNVSAKGRLLQLLSAPSASPRWLVTFDSTSWKDEELYECAFRTISDDESNRETPPGDFKKRLANSVVKTYSSSSDADNARSKTISTTTNATGKVVTFSECSTNPSGGDSSSARHGNLSAREQRSMRRQAKEPESEITMSTTSQVRPIRQRSRRSENSPSSQKKSKRNEEVVKIPMLTGMLLLYRSENGSRRAEFVRKF